MTAILVQVTAPHFCAMLVVELEDDLISEAAPILAWAVGRRWSWFQVYARQRQWSWTEGPDPR